MNNPFQRFPEKGPLKLLVYGDPGTEKTRRALVMPGPVYVIDMENGSADYGALVTGDDFYLPTKSHREVMGALKYLATLKLGEVGTVVVDPIGVVWESIKQGHIARMMRKGWYFRDRQKVPINDPEEVPFEMATWGVLKRTYGDILSMLITAPYHVVLVARGKNATNHKGDVIGYKFEGEKSTDYLANVVIESHKEGDIVIKDRTGTYPEGKRPRVNFLDLLPNTGTDATRMQTDSDAAKVDSDYRWPDEDRVWFCAQLGGIKVKYDDFAAYFEDAKGLKRPSSFTRKQLEGILAKLKAPDSEQLYEFESWLGKREDSEAAA